MALVLNATKDFCTDKMNIDSGGIRDSGGQLSEPLSDKEPGTYKCSFCPSVFPTLYHLQCHNVYKHSSILSNGHRGDLPSEFQNRQLAEVRYGSYPLDLKSSVTYQSHNVAQNEKIPISESGALDLSTVRCRNTQEPKPECIQVSSSVDNEAEDSDNEESDKLVIDTQIEIESTPEKSSDSPHREYSPNRWSNSPLSQSKDFLNKNSNHNGYSNSSTIYNSQYLSHYPDSGNIGKRKTFEEKTPSSEYHTLDNRSVSPARNNSQQPDNTKPSETLNYSSSFLNRAPESKYSTLDNQSLLSMIPPLPHIGMMGNFPMPFGFSPFMMMPPNSFMQPPIVGNVAENRFSLPSMQSDTYSSALPYNPNLNLQPNKPGPVRKSSENKSRSSSKNGNIGKTKDVVEIYDCKTCNRRFTQVGNFHNHMKTHESKICACGICSMEFGDSYELQRHMRNTHTGSMPYKCDECDREFSQYNNLRRHLRVHNGKNYKCHLCGRTFNEVFYLEMHMGSHTGERTYKCGVCNATYSDNAELQKHVSTHSAEELHTCNVCGKSFSKACVLRQHKKMHSGVRPFKCEVCDKSFIHRHHLTIHARMHSTNKPYTCKICKKDFAQTSHLYKHIRQHTEQPGVTEEMIHESLAPILEKLKKSKDSPDTLSQNDANEEKLTDAINNNNIKRETTMENAMKLSQIGSPKESVNLESEEQDKNCKGSSLQKETQSDEESAAVDNKASPPLVNVKQIMDGSLKEIERLMNQGNRKRLGSVEKDHDLESLHDSSAESDDNASDKTGVSYASSVSEKRFLNSPPAVIPYNEQCLQERPYPRIPSYESGQSQENDFTKKDGDCANKYNLNNETSQKIIKKEDSSKYDNNDRYSPISQSGDSLSEGDFRSRSNSACENLRPVYSSSKSTVSPRVVSSDSILKEQPIPTDNYETKTEIVMPLKKRRRYTPRQKKKSQDLPEEQQPTYQQMIQPMSAEAQQIYFIQLQQMQMALAANVMAAQGMMLQRSSDVSKNLHAENLRNIPNGYSHNSDMKDPVMRQSLFGTPLKGSIPYPMSLTKDGDLQDMSRGSPFQNGSLINHSVTRASYL